MSKVVANVALAAAVSAAVPQAFAAHMDADSMQNTTIQFSQAANNNSRVHVDMSPAVRFEKKRQRRSYFKHWKPRHRHGGRYYGGRHGGKGRVLDEFNYRAFSKFLEWLRDKKFDHKFWERICKHLDEYPKPGGGGDDPSPVPLPASAVLLSSAVAGLGLFRRREGKKPAPKALEM